jgi:hypothetical protein
MIGKATAEHTAVPDRRRHVRLDAGLVELANSIRKPAAHRISLPRELELEVDELTPSPASSDRSA